MSTRKTLDAVLRDSNADVSFQRSLGMDANTTNPTTRATNALEWGCHLNSVALSEIETCGSDLLATVHIEGVAWPVSWYAKSDQWAQGWL